MACIGWLLGSACANAHEAPADELRGSARRTATIHWDQVPLRDAVARLEKVFGESIFIDRRVDPGQRVTLDVVASSADEVLAKIGEGHGLGVGRVGPLIYFGPRAVVERLAALSAAKEQELARLDAGRRASTARKQIVSWSRLSEPRSTVQLVVERCGIRVVGLERVQHDLWAAGDLPALSLAEQLTVLLVGFDLTFDVRPAERAVEIVPLDASQVAKLQSIAERPRQLASRRTTRTPAKAKQVYTLRVAEQPVDVVLRELSRRLRWPIDVDEAAMRAAGLSLEQRVSFAVENVSQDELLEALLEPAGLTFQRAGERIKIVPRQ